MSNPSFSPQDVQAWLSRRNGLFERDSENKCWRAAFMHFEDDRGFGEGGYMDFQFAVEDAGYAVRPTALGGFILDKVKQ